MRIELCDVCLSKGEERKSNFRRGFARGVKIDACSEHRNWGGGLSREEFSKEAMKLIEKARENSGYRN